MAQRILKQQLFFDQVGGAGFSESWMFQDNSLSVDPAPVVWNPLQAYDAQAIAFADKRSYLMGQNTTIEILRMSVVGSKGQSRVIKRRTTGIAFDSDNVTSALLLRLTDATGTKKSFHPLRGVPDAICVSGGVYTPNPATIPLWQGYMNAFTALVQGKYGWLGKATAVVANVLTVVQVGPYVAVTTDGTPFAGRALNSTAQVTFRGVLGSVEINGTQTVTVLSPSSCRLVVPVNISTTIMPSGTMRISTAGLIVTALAEPYKIGERRAGRQAFVSRGRSRNRRRR